eukprot:TRINITY_DN12211_c0_g6_i1.p4 TRINITY_DN12211_c0_g6~~TRINITY_DN12211_c0_g6_i1.p4  ORF type:complete len:110 (-),score=7.50 TRINITY_DN12211_c0_g6_i1:1677-2006(-)
MDKIGTRSAEMAMTVKIEPSDELFVAFVLVLSGSFVENCQDPKALALLEWQQEAEIMLEMTLTTSACPWDHLRSWSIWVSLLRFDLDQQDDGLHDKENVSVLLAWHELA